MSEQWLNEAEELGDKSDDFASWCEMNTELIIDRYIESIDTLDDVPESFRELMYEQYSQED